jgi:glycosyltransferase involved in cell wall biosynthesis
MVSTRVPSPLKVTFFINSLEQGGAERQLAELISGLDPSRFRPSLIVCVDRDQLGYRLPVERIVSLDAPMFPTPRSVQRLTTELRALRPDIVHTFMGWENIFGRIAARRARVPAVVSSVRCTRLPRKHLVGEALTYRMADALIVNSIGIRDELAVRARVPRDRIDVIENGVDTGRFQPQTEPAKASARLEWRMTGPTLVVPGRICEQKNQLAVVRALARMRRLGNLPKDAKVIFAGRDSHVTYGLRVRALVALAGLASVVEVVGVVREIARLVGSADGVLLPSRYEGLPNAVIEAMASGTPVLVSQPANTDALVTDGVEGFVCETNDAAGIARTLERFFSSSAAARATMGASGLAHARRRFSVERMVAKTAAVYERILDVPKARVVHDAGHDERV